MTTIQETRTQIGRSHAAARRAREAARAGAVRRRHARPADAAREGAAQPDRARPDRLDRHVGGGEDARRRLRPDRGRPPGHRSLLRARDQGPADRRDRQGALPRRAGGGRRRRDRTRPQRPPSRRSPSSTTSCRWSRTSSRRGRRRRAARHRARVEAGPLPRPRRAPAPRRQRLLPLPDRPRRAGGGLRPRGHRRRGRVHVPVRLPVRDGDAHGDRPGRGRRDHALGDLPAPVPRARRDRRPVRRAGRQRADPGAVSRRRLRLQVVHEDGAADGRARAEGRAAGADPEPRRRVDGHDPPTQHDLPDAHGGDGGRPPARARGRVPVRHRCLRGQRPARGRDRRATPRPAPTAGRPTASTPRASTRTSRLPARTARSARRISSGSASRRWTRWRGGPASIRSMSAARTCSPRARRCAPAGSRSTPTSSATSRKSPPPSAGATEKGPLVGRGVSVGLLAAGAHPVSSAICRLEADGRVVVLVGTTEMGQGPRTAFAQIAAEEIGVEPEQVTVRGADTRFTPVRPLDRGEPLDDDRGPRRPARGGGHPRAARADRRHVADRGGRAPRADAASTSASRAAS